MKWSSTTLAIACFAACALSVQISPLQRDLAHLRHDLAELEELKRSSSQTALAADAGNRPARIYMTTTPQAADPENAAAVESLERREVRAAGTASRRRRTAQGSNNRASRREQDDGSAYVPPSDNTTPVAPPVAVVDPFALTPEDMQEARTTSEIVVQVPNRNPITVQLLTTTGLHPNLYNKVSTLDYVPFDVNVEEDVVKMATFFKWTRAWISQWTVGDPGKFLKRILLPKKLLIGGAEYGGVFYGDPRTSNFLTMQYPTSGVGYGELSNTMTHEGVHLFQFHLCGGEDTSNAWNRKWNALLPAGFTWKGQNPLGTRTYNETYWSQGFLTGYNQVSMSEDVAQIATALWSGAKNAWDAINNNEIIRKKADLIVELFAMLDPAFTMAFFEARKKDTTDFFAFNNEHRDRLGGDGKDQTESHLVASNDVPAVRGSDGEEAFPRSWSNVAFNHQHNGAMFNGQKYTPSASA